MKALRRFIRIALVFLVCSICLLFTFSYIVRKYFEEDVTRIIVNELNGVLKARVDVKDINFSVFYSFPRVSLDFRNVVIYSSPDFKSSEFSDGEKVLFSKSISLRFNIIDLYYHRYDIKSIVLKDTYLWILKDSKGNDNFHIWNDATDTTGTFLSISLEKIISENLFFWYGDPLYKVSGFLDKIEFAGQYKSGDLLAVSKMQGNIQSFQNEGFKYVQKIPFKLSANLQIQDTASYFTNTQIQSRDLDLNFDCILGYKNDLSYLINLKEGSTSFEAIKWFLPDSLFKDVSTYNPEGDFVFSGKIEKGTNEKYGSAKLHLFSKNISAVYQDKKFSTSGLLYYELPNFSQPTVFSINTDAFKVTVDSKNWMQISMLYTNSLSAKSNITFDSQFAANENVLNSLFPISVHDFSGAISGTSSGTFMLNDFKTIPDLKNVKANIEMFNISMLYDNIIIEDLNGRLVLDQNSVQLPTLQLTINKTRLSATCALNTIEPLLFSTKQTLLITADVKSDSLNYELITTLQHIGDNDQLKNSSDDTASQNDSIPYQVDLHVDLGMFVYENHLMTDVNANLELAKDSLLFIVDNVNTSFGSLRIKGQYSFQNRNLDFNSDFKRLKISNFFSEFNDFDQTYLTNRNISGSLSGRVVAHIPFSESMDVLRPKMNITSVLTIDDGRLVDFPPLLEMSKYLNEAELSSIQFDRIENVFSLRNDSIFIPKMLISSSIADFSVSGEQSLENNFDNKVHIVLNKVISVRRKKRLIRDHDEDFGEIEDDGLGRTSLPLHIFGNPDDFKIEYDRLAAKEVLKNKWKLQNEELKSILKDEFRLNNSDQNDKNKELPSDFDFNWGD